MGQTPEVLNVDVAGGTLGVHDLTVGPADDGAPVVLAAHGITANGLMWQPVADELARRRGPGAVRFLAPDLRGRALSNAVHGPFGLAAHASDLVCVASAVGARPLLVGHSMGAFIAALTAATAPQSFRGVVLVDGGLAFPAPADLDIDATLVAVIGPAMERLRMRFASQDDYLGFWAEHPALGPVLAGAQGEAVRRYVLHDLLRTDAGDWVSSCVLDAVRADGADVLADASHPRRGAGGRCRRPAGGVPVGSAWAPRRGTGPLRRGAARRPGRPPRGQGHRRGRQPLHRGARGARRGCRGRRDRASAGGAGEVTQVEGELELEGPSGLLPVLAEQV